MNFEAALEVAAEGKTFREVAEALGCSPSKLSRLRANNPEFDRELTRAREDGFGAMADSLLTIVEDNPTLNPHLVRLKSDNIKWLLSKLHARVFGDKIDISITERVDLKSALIESKARLRVINPAQLSTNPLEE